MDSPPYFNPKRHHLCVADKTLLRSVIGVDVNTSKAKSLVPGVSRRGILSTRTQVGLSFPAGGNGIGSSVADVDELVADAVEDDVGVD